MNVSELIEQLEGLPPKYPVVIDGVEITEVTEVFLRNELYLTADHGYDEGLVIKIY